MKNSTMLLLVCILLVIPGVASADTGRAVYAPDFSQGTWGCGLDLSVEQTEKLRHLQEGFLHDTRDLRERLDEKQGELRRLWNRRNPDQEKITATENEIDSLETRIRQKAERYRLESTKILTPEQQAQMGAYGQGFGPGYGRRGGGFGPGRGMGFGSCPRW